MLNVNIMEEKEMCEQCLEDPAVLDGLVGGDYKRLCNGCAALEGAVKLDGRSNIDISKVNTRRTVKEILMGMSGIAKPGLKKKEVHIDDLRRVKNEREKENKNFDDQMKHINDPDEEKPWSKWVRGFKRNEKKPNPQARPEVKLDEVKEGDVLDI